MAINATNTAVNTLQLQQLVSMRQAPKETPRSQEGAADRTRYTAQPRQEMQMRTAEQVRRQEPMQQPQQTQQASSAKPVVNAQGQKTGTIINTTA